MRPVCARFFNDLLLLHIRGVHGQAVGRTFYEHVRPDGAQNIRLISNTDKAMSYWMVSGGVYQRPYIRETMHSALNL